MRVLSDRARERVSDARFQQRVQVALEAETNAPSNLQRTDEIHLSDTPPESQPNRE